MSQDRMVPDSLAALGTEYEILSEIGRGGISVVYLARDRILGREVAIKVIHDRFLEDREARIRADSEARTLARLHHPNIVTILGARRLESGALALIMQLARGRTLRAVLQHSGRLHYETAVAVLRQTAAALGYLHERGIVHRDVKPENLFVEEDGTILLSDLGIAKANDAPTNVTLTGVVVGTPAYMSPEQIDGDALDGRSDLYSLGLVGHELLSGVRPWEGENLFKVIIKQKTESLPALETLRPDVPPHVRHALECAMAKDRAQRWTDMREFIEHLEGGAAPAAAAWMRTPAPRAAPAAASDATLANAPLVAVPVAAAPLYAAPLKEAPLAGVPLEGASLEQATPVAAAASPTPGFSRETGAAAWAPAPAAAGGAASEPVEARDSTRRWAVAAASATMLLAGGAVLALASTFPAVQDLSRAASLAAAAIQAAPVSSEPLPVEPAAGAAAAKGGLTPAGSTVEPSAVGPRPVALRDRTAAERSAGRAASSAAAAAAAPFPPVPAPGSVQPQVPAGSGRAAVAAVRPLEAPVNSAEAVARSLASTRLTAPTLRNADAVLNQVRQFYPAALVEEKAGGTVILALTINERGRVTASEVGTSSGNPQLDAVALRVSRQMHFSPALRDEQPVLVRVEVPLTIQP